MKLHNVFVLLFTGLLSACDNSQDFITILMANGALSINIPRNWKQLEVNSRLRIYKPNLFYLGKDTFNGCFVDMVSSSSVQPNIKYFAAKELELVKVRNPMFRITSTTTDSVSGKILIDYQGVYNKIPCFFRHVVYLRRNRHFVLNFRGSNNLNFRREVDFITNNVHARD